jgi:hypothetical protein
VLRNNEADIQDDRGHRVEAVVGERYIERFDVQIGTKLIRALYSDLKTH